MLWCNLKANKLLFLSLANINYGCFLTELVFELENILKIDGIY